MASLIEQIPRFELRGGIVHVVDECGDRAMSLGTFVAATKLANKLCLEWVAEVGEPAQIRTGKRVKVGEAGH